MNIVDICDTDERINFINNIINNDERRCTIKNIEWEGRIYRIFCSNENRISWIISILNSLILYNKYEIPNFYKIKLKVVQLIKILIEYLSQTSSRVNKKLSKKSYESNLCSLYLFSRTGMAMNCNFSSTKSFGVSRILNIVNSCDIPIYHCWLYNNKEYKIAESSNNCDILSFFEFYFNSNTLCNIEKKTRNFKNSQGDFNFNNMTEITPDGLVEVKNSCAENVPGILYYNNRFGTFIKKNNTIYEFETSIEFSSLKYVVFKEINESNMPLYFNGYLEAIDKSYYSRNFVTGINYTTSKKFETPQIYLNIINKPRKNKQRICIYFPKIIQISVFLKKIIQELIKFSVIMCKPEKGIDFNCESNINKKNAKKRKKLNSDILKEKKNNESIEIDSDKEELIQEITRRKIMRKNLKNISDIINLKILKPEINSISIENHNMIEEIKPNKIKSLKSNLNETNLLGFMKFAKSDEPIYKITQNSVDDQNLYSKIKTIETRNISKEIENSCIFSQIPLMVPSYSLPLECDIVKKNKILPKSFISENIYSNNLIKAIQNRDPDYELKNLNQNNNHSIYLKKKKEYQNEEKLNSLWIASLSKYENQNVNKPILYNDNIIMSKFEDPSKIFSKKLDCLITGNDKNTSNEIKEVYPNNQK